MISISSARGAESSCIVNQNLLAAGNKYKLLIRLRKKVTQVQEEGSMITHFWADMRPFGPLARALAALAAAAGLAGCIHSASPILTDGKPIFGNETRFQFYGLQAGGARDAQHARYRWDGSRYVFVDGDYKDTSAFTMHPLAGRDFVVQSIDAKPERRVEYALARRLAEGVYLVIAIDEKDAGAATRVKYCAKGTSCRIETRKALLVFARATAAKRYEKGGLALQVAEEKR
jgi:hypothetical protein